MEKEKKADLIKKLDYLAIFVFLFALIVGGYLYYNDPYVFCTEMKVNSLGEEVNIDPIDLGEKCFKTLGENREHQKYLINKYMDYLNNTQNTPEYTNLSQKLYK